MNKKVFSFLAIFLFICSSTSETKRSRHIKKPRLKVWCIHLKNFVGICNRRADTQRFSVKCGAFKLSHIALMCNRCRAPHGICSENIKLFSVFS
ncbi:unnamed protein product [Clavelina lepadiformis]|uniref:Secreted protein n=1 Tax=Clavelina lepadiformis TaxID=159417 RepID=A0ABP0GCR6_CLALP